MDTPPLIKSLQSRPYEQRIRLLWLGTAVGAVIVIGTWWGLSRLLPGQPSSTPQPALDALKKQFEEIPDNLAAIQSPAAKPTVAGLPEDYHALVLKNFSIDKEKKQIILNITVNNPSSDILVLLNQARANITLLDGSTTLSPASITLNTMPFPSKILSKRAYTSQIIFPEPKSKKVTLLATDMYFETQPSQTFSEKLEIELESKVKGSTTILPRE